ncbi:PAS domain-containing protein [Aggregicoccus sp. 17bor-14]|nr:MULTISPECIES: ATP-binding protein [Myxococcaceae]MBF5044735.1 PAS domain-containing protein [Simulacricoccus sp. 17bor-14]MRI90480.1 PAS domain-containing protein [Aggregicoccus sp. 17bor-14]
MVAIAARLLSGPPRDLTREELLAFALLGAVYVLTLVYGLLLRQGRGGKFSAYAQVVGDVALATGLVYVTGCADSPFIFTYSLAVVAASILLFERGARTAAALSSVAYVAMVLLAQAGWLHPPDGGAHLPPGRLFFVLGSHVLAQFLIAVLAGYLSRQLLATGGQLSATTADLQQLAALQRQILASMPSGLITSGEHGRITFINPAARALLGLEEGAETDEQLERFLPGVQGLGPHARRRELAVQTPHGLRTLGLTITPLESGDQALLIVFQDLTDLRRMEAALRRADALASLGTLSAQLAHEIRNPLAAMRGSAQMLAQDLAEQPAQARLLSIVLREADRLSRLVEEFLRFARPPRPARQVVNLASLVEETLEMLRADPLATDVVLGGQVAAVEAEVDPDQMRQVLLNLLRNALQATGAGGEVRVQLEASGGEARLRVWDSAGSVPAEDLVRIFEPFVSSRPGGTGLGLSTAHAIVQAHGGMIEVTSSPQAGTEFTITLPLDTAEASRAHPGR